VRAESGLYVAVQWLRCRAYGRNLFLIHFKLQSQSFMFLAVLLINFSIVFISGHEKPIVASSPSSSPVLLRCLACSKTYRTTVALDDHWATAHNNADHNGSSSKCDVCGKEFAKKKEFYAHKLIHRWEIYMRLSESKI
jgi:hypothetical protein